MSSVLSVFYEGGDPVVFSLDSIPSNFLEQATLDSVVKARMTNLKSSLLNPPSRLQRHHQVLLVTFHHQPLRSSCCRKYKRFEKVLPNEKPIPRKYYGLDFTRWLIQGYFENNLH